MRSPRRRSASCSRQQYLVGRTTSAGQHSRKKVDERWKTQRGAPQHRGRRTAATRSSHGRGAAATLHAGRTPTTKWVGESPPRVADRAGAGDGGGAEGAGGVLPSLAGGERGCRVCPTGSRRPSRDEQSGECRGASAWSDFSCCLLFRHVRSSKYVTSRSLSMELPHI